MDMMALRRNLLMNSNLPFSYKKVYSFVIEDDNGIQMNLIPCVRKSDNKPGMYDKVSDTFLTNQGIGEFIIPS